MKKKLSDLEIKQLMSYYLHRLKNPITNTIRLIIYSSKYEIDWQEAYQQMLTDMPELENKLKDKQFREDCGFDW